MLNVRASSHVLIPQHGPPAPHIVNDGDCTFQVLFSPSLGPEAFDSLHELWSLAQKAVTSCNGTDSAPARRSLEEIIAAHERACILEPGMLPPGENVVLQTRVKRLRPLCVEPGWAVITEGSLCFVPYHASSPQGTATFSLGSIARVWRRDVGLDDLALETYFNTGASLFLCFVSSDERNAFTAAVKNEAALPVQPALDHWTGEWCGGRLSNYDYLMRLNEAAGRSFNDLTRYPVFPWILSDYTSSTVDLGDPEIFRDLSRPIGALNPGRLRQAREMHAALLSSGASEPAYMYGSHYSNPGAVVFYLARARPELMLHLQSGRFDAPDRLFTSVAGAWESVSRWNSDVKELIPEFYTPGASAFLVNRTDVEFGARSDGSAVGDVVLPLWAASPEDFLEKMAAALEAPAVSARLHKWIDLVFGVKARGKKAVQADNVFHFMTYDDM